MKGLKPYCSRGRTLQSTGFQAGFLFWRLSNTPLMQDLRAEQLCASSPYKGGWLGTAEKASCNEPLQSTTSPSSSAHRLKPSSVHLSSMLFTCNNLGNDTGTQTHTVILWDLSVQKLAGGRAGTTTADFNFLEPERTSFTCSLRRICAGTHNNVN